MAAIAPPLPAESSIDLATKSESSQKSVCFHCLESLPKYTDIVANIGASSRAVCCYGCKAAAEYIDGAELGDFYIRRATSKPQSTSGKPLVSAQDWVFLDQEKSSLDYIRYASDGSRKLHLYVPGIYCASCTWLIERALAKTSENINVSIDLQSKRMVVELLAPSLKFSDVLLLVKRLGYDPSPLKIASLNQNPHEGLRRERRASLMRIAVAAMGMMQVMTYAVATYFGDAQGMEEPFRRFLNLISLLVATAVVFYAGKPFFNNAWNDLKKWRVGMDVPIALAIGGAYLPSVYLTLFNQPGHVYFDSAVMFVFFLSVGRFVETRARHKLDHASQSMQHLLPTHIQVERYQSGELTRHSIEREQVQIGDRVLLCDGQVSPFDGVVQSGHASIDESMITGESLVLSKGVAANVVAGSVIIQGALSIEVRSLWESSSFAKIEALSDRARSNDLRQSRGVEGIAEYFVQFVLALTLIVGLVWWWYDPSRVLQIVLAMLVASCPCAFALAGPLGNTAASKAMRSKGMLLANFQAVAIWPTITTWCFDKTGTLTMGRPSIQSIETFSNCSSEACLRIAASLGQMNNHVLSRAFQVSNKLSPVEKFKQVPGEGVSGIIAGQKYSLGSASWVSAQVATVAQSSASNSIQTSVFLANSKQLIARFEVSDQTRPTALAAISGLNKAQIKTGVLSGDQTTAVEHAVAGLPIDLVEGGLLPEQKLNYVKHRQSLGERVAMVGDGANDAPVMAQADLSIAMADANDLAHSQADIVLLNGRLDNLNSLAGIANKALLVTRQNLRWSLLYNGLALPLAASGYLSPWLAALGMSFSSVLVVLNAFRIGRSSSMLGEDA
jgi:Cu2+-exporting ATPase